MHINSYAIIMLNPTDKNHMIQIVNHAIQMETFYDANIKKGSLQRWTCHDFNNAICFFIV